MSHNRFHGCGWGDRGVEVGTWMDNSCVRKEGGGDKLRTGRGHKRDVSHGGREKDARGPENTREGLFSP